MQAWHQFLAHLEQELGVQTVAQWLRPLKIVRFDAANLYLQVEDPLQVSWFEEHVRHRLKALCNQNFRPIKVHFLSPASPAKPTPPPHFSIAPSSLDPALTLGHFLPSPENQVALDLVCSLTFNPIFLYGPAGSGKTHLLTAAALNLQSKGKRAFYIRAETFTEHVVQAIRSSLMQDFRRIYRDVDALLIDDVHILSRKAATQEEFFHTFNALHTLGKPILLSANTPPSKLLEIEARLISRFEWGIALPLTPHPMRELLLHKAALWNFPLTDDLLAYLLEHFPKQPLRALQALVLRASAPPTPKAAAHLLRDLLEQEQRDALTPDQIIRSIAAHYVLTAEDLLGTAQTRDVTFPRKVAMYLCRKSLHLSFQKIGALFHRDHSTVMTSIKHIEREIETQNPDLLEVLSKIKS